MKNYKFITLAICAMLQIYAKQIQSAATLPSTSTSKTATDRFAKWKNLYAKTKQALNPMSKEQQIQHQVNMILEWSRSKTKEELNQIKDIIQFLNPRPGDSDIILEAKKIAKEKLFPAEKSYWQQYAPQFMQNAVTSTKNYIYYLTPQFIKDRLYPTSTMTMPKQILGKTKMVTIVNLGKMTPEELKNALELKPPTSTNQLTILRGQESATKRYENPKEKIENWLESQN